MSAEHFHLLLNHGPLFAVAFSLPLLVFGLLRRNTSVSRVALVGLVVAALLAIPVFMSGNEAEHSAEHLPGVSEYYIEEHEESAELTLWLTEVLGAAALVVLGISLKKQQIQRVLLFVVLLIGAGVFVSIAYTNNLGGKIRHSELRSQTGSEQLLQKSTP